MLLLSIFARHKETMRNFAPSLSQEVRILCATFVFTFVFYRDKKASRCLWK